MKLRLLTAAFATSLTMGLSACQAGDSEIHQAIQSLAPGAKVTQISKTGVKGIMEVAIDGDQGPMVVYADEKGQFLLVGDLLDVKGKRNLTREHKRCQHYCEPEFPAREFEPREGVRRH